MTPRTSSTKAAREFCEALLKSERSDLLKQAILPSKVEIINRLLARGLELADAYEEVYSKLDRHPLDLKVIFERLQTTAALWSPAANQEARIGRTKLIEVNREIKETAHALAVLLNKRTELQNHSGFSCDTLYHPIDAIHSAADQNPTYEQWVKEPLETIRGEFDLKYWPSLGDVVQAIANDAAQATPLPNDPLTKIGTDGSRAGLAGTFKAFLCAIDESRSRKFGLLPTSFTLTDRCIAILMSCALGLGPDDGVVDSAYVKRLRQRERKKI